MAKDSNFYEDCSAGRWTDAGGLYEEAPQPCIQCSQLTHRLDVTFEAFICSDDEEAVTLAYGQALNG